MTTFNDFGLDQNILRSINDMGFEEPSPIQEEAIPLILQGIDVLGQAQTGTGKTAAFGIPIVEKMTSAPKVQALVLTPTRELAIQVSGELRKLSKHKGTRTLPIYGGQSIGQQIRTLRQGVHVVIGTPGRILDHLRRKTLHLEDVNMVVLDEADEMLDMGFVEDIKEILSHTPETRQTMLFSATMPHAIKELTRRYMQNPKTIQINRKEVAAPLIDQVYYKVLERNKMESLCRILDSEEIGLGIVFCRTKRGVDELTDSLQGRGYLADGLHGDLSQAQRDRVMNGFRDSSIELLVATDVAARGIDVGNVTHVINYDIPQDPEGYVHRIGRTGRAGRKGIAVTLVTPREMKQLMTIEKITKSALVPRAVPTVEEVAERQQVLWKDRITSLLEEDVDMSLFMPIVEELKDRFSMEHITAAALHVAFSSSLQGEEEGYNFGETGATKGLVRFFMNVGRNVDMNRSDFVKEVSEMVGIPSKSIGRIDIFDRFTFFEVTEEVAPFVYEALRQSRIKGARVNVEPAKPRGSKS